MLRKHIVIMTIVFLFLVFYTALYRLHLSSSKHINFNLILNGTFKERMYNECRAFSQRSRLLGPLQRNSSNGQLFFPDVKMSLQDVYLLLRYSPRKEDEGGLYLPLATSYLLSKNLQQLSIEQRIRTKVAVFLSERFTDDMYNRLEKWFQSIYGPYTNVTHIIRTKAGNQASWEYMMNHTKHNKDVQLNTILFLLEDDYIYEETMLVDTIEFFASHNPCFVHLTDYPDRYIMNINDDDGHITIVAGKTRLWRSITSTTVTYACRFRTYLAFEDTIMQPQNDWGACRSIRERAGNAVFFSAIPSHGAHSETLLRSNDDKDQSQFKIVVAAFYKDWWLFGRRALFEAQKQENFPTDKLSEITM